MSFLQRPILTFVASSLCTTIWIGVSTYDAEGLISSAPTPQVFAPGVVSGPANDGSPTFAPDGNTIFFTRSTANWSVIVESHKVHGQWSHPTLSPFSGEWSDSSPAMAPDGSYLVACRSEFVTTDASVGVGVLPANGAGIRRVGIDISAELSRQVGD